MSEENKQQTTEIKERNRKLCERYPFLIPSNRWSGMRITEAADGGYWPGDPKEVPEYDYEYTELDQMPDGWRIAFGDALLEELREELLKAGYLDDYRITQIKEKYGCYDWATEVLTKDGWKHFSDVKMDDEFATLDADGETLIYQKPEDIISYHYTGKMYHIENRGVSLRVTENHSLYVSKGSYYRSGVNTKRTYPFEFAAPDKYFGKDKRFKKGATWIGKEPESDTFTIPGYTCTNEMKINHCMRTYTYDPLSVPLMAWLKFLGFYIAEGHADTRNGNGTQISVAYNPDTEEHLVDSLISGIGMEPKSGGKPGLKRFHNCVMTRWLIENCGNHATEKRVPAFIKELPPKYIVVFLEYLYIGDGHKTSTSNILTTTSKQLRDDVCELLLKAGYSFRCRSRDRWMKCSEYNGNLIISKNIAHDISWLKGNYVEIDNSKHPKGFIEQWEDYDGMVYCVTIPSHILYVRRNGRGVWCGNSLRWYDNGNTERGYEILGKYADLSRRTCIVCGKPATRITTGWISPYCDDCVGNERSVPIREWFHETKEDGDCQQ